jgi:integrase
MAKTRNAHGQAKPRKRYDKSGKLIRWEIRYDAPSHNGKRVQRSIYGKSQEDVIEKYDEIKGNIKTNTNSEPTKLTVEQWCYEWLSVHTGKGGELKPRTRANYESVIRLHIAPAAIGTTKLRDLKKKEIKKFYKDLSAKLSASSVRLVAATLHAALELACDDDYKYIIVNPAHKITLPKVDKTVKNVFDSDDITIFRQAIRGHLLEHLFTLALATGLRQSEVMGLRWTDIDFKRDIINVNTQLTRKENRVDMFGTTKSNKGREVTLTMTAINALREQEAKQAQMKLNAGGLWGDPHNLIFTNELGDELLHGRVSAAFKRIVRAAGYPDAKFHDLRHFYTTASLYMGADVKTVADSLGHHSAKFMLDNYAHSTEQMKRDAAAKLESFLEGTSIQKFG